MKKTLIAFACATICGCAAQSQLTYAPLRPDLDGWKKFTLPQSKILVTLDPASGEPVAQAVPIDTYPGAEKKSLMFREVGGALAIRSTAVTSLTYVDNTRIVSAIGTTATSHVAEILSIAAKAVPTLAAIAASTGPLATANAVPAADPFRATSIDPFDADGGLVDAKPRDLPSNKGWTYTVKPLASTPDAVAYRTFADAALAGNASTVFPASSCIDVQLDVSGPLLAANQVRPFAGRYRLILADPSNVQTIALPTDGKITMHPQCGYNVEDHGARGIDTAALGNSVELVKALLDAQKK